MFIISGGPPIRVWLRYYLCDSCGELGDFTAIHDSVIGKAFAESGVVKLPVKDVLRLQKAGFPWLTWEARYG